MKPFVIIFGSTSAVTPARAEGLAAKAAARARENKPAGLENFATPKQRLAVGVGRWNALI
jgi:hypothetical protein